jgi:hypothetical protein
MRATICVAVLTVLMAGCDQPASDQSGCNHSHLPKGPNGLDLLELGAGQGFVEFAFHLEHGAFSVYLLNDKRERESTTANPILRLTHSGKNIELRLEPAPASERSLWTASDSALKSEPEKAVLVLAGEGTPREIELPVHIHHD